MGHYEMLALHALNHTEVIKQTIMYAAATLLQ